MSSKRGFDDSGDEHDESGLQPVSKRARREKGGNKKKKHHQNAHTDPTWGQKYVFSSHEHATTIPAGEESDFEDDADAMAYLMSVRTEATDIPHLLVAPKSQIGPQLPADFDANEHHAEAEDGEVDEFDEFADRETLGEDSYAAKGYYEDGAYFGVGDDEEYDEEYDEETSRTLQEAYSASLLDRYLQLRKTLNINPPTNAKSQLPSSTLTEAAPFGRTSRTSSLWSKALSTTDPHPLQLALLSKDSLFLVLRVLLQGKFLQRGYPLPERTSRWLWALLARLPDSGELTHWELGWVRDLGKRAVLLGRSLAEMVALREELEEGGLGVNEGVDGRSDDSQDVPDVDPLISDDGPAPDDPDEAKPTKPDVTSVFSGEGQVRKVTDEVGPTSLDPGVAQDQRPAKQLEEPTDPETKSVIPGEGLVAEDANEVDLTNLDTNVAQEKAPAGHSEGPSPQDDGVEEGEVEEGEVSEGTREDVAMDLDSSSEEGEAREDDNDLEAVRARLLAQLVETNDAEAVAQRLEERSRMNMRVTVHMILTVVGDFYGQRDLLEFREPFTGM